MALNNEKIVINDFIVDCLALLIDEDVEIYRKQAALLLLKHYLPKDFLEELLSDKEFFPFDRNDKRVSEWKKEVLKRGKCALCGSTERLEAHHIIKWCDYPQWRIDVKNGACLCHECHTEQHRYDPSYHMMKAK